MMTPIGIDSKEDNDEEFKSQFDQAGQRRRSGRRRRRGHNPKRKATSNPLPPEKQDGAIIPNTCTFFKILE